MPSKAWKKASASAMTSAPTTFEIDRMSAWAATFTARTMPRVGDMSRRYRRWSRKCASRCGASRKSSALRVGGVSTTTRS
jgi:hypothetical protein